MKTFQKKNNGFFDSVYDVVCLIPLGRVTSYGSIAAYLGSPQSSRMVGWAMNNAHQQTRFIPAHRVVNRNGILSGKHHFNGTDTMQQMLESEGIQIENDKVIDFKNLFWNPAKELTL